MDRMVWTEWYGQNSSNFARVRNFINKSTINHAFSVAVTDVEMGCAVHKGPLRSESTFYK